MSKQEKIILMTKLALYEKKHKTNDKRCLDYYMEDYIYIHNFRIRLGITLLIVVVMMFGAIKTLQEKAIIPNSALQFIKVYVGPYILPWLIMVVLYTFISTLIYSKRYKKAQRRYNQYKSLINTLTVYESDEEGATYESK